MIRKAFMIAAAAALPLGMVAIAGASSSGASTPPTVANGTVNCTTVSGKIAFTPPLTTSGNSHLDGRGGVEGLRLLEHGHEPPGRQHHHRCGLVDHHDHDERHQRQQLHRSGR